MREIGLKQQINVYLYEMSDQKIKNTTIELRETQIQEIVDTKDHSLFNYS